MSRHARPAKPGRAAYEGDRRFVSALARGLDVMRCFSASREWLPNKDIARLTGLPKTTVSRLTFTLTALGYLRYSPERELYALDLPVLGLGHRVLAHFEIGRIAEPFMQELADAAMAAVSLGVRHGDVVIYVAHRRSSAPLTIGLDVGARLPLATSVIGRAILSGMTQEARVAALAACGAGQQQDRGPIDIAGDELSRHGFVMSAKNDDVGVVAMPLRIDGSRNLFGLNCGGPAGLFTRDRLLRELGPALRETAGKIEAAVRSRLDI
jgi:DNA-binding IclR family transcriptional regulator